MFHRITETFDQSVFGVSIVPMDKTLGCQRAFVATIDGDMDMRSPRSIGNRLDRSKIITSVAPGHEAPEALEIGIALRSGEPSVFRVDIRAFIICLPNLNARVGNRIAFQIRHLAMKMGDRSHGWRDPIVDSQKIIIRIQRKLVRIKRSLRHRRGFGKRFSKNPGHSKKSSGTQCRSF